MARNVLPKEPETIGARAPARWPGTIAPTRRTGMLSEQEASKITQVAAILGLMVGLLAVAV